MTTTRQEKIDEGVQKFLETNRKATLVMGTGVGKSKVALDLIKELQPENILLLTSGTLLRDENWKNEFIKFGMEDWWDMVVSECYQTAYKWSGRHFQFVIADEIDFAMTEVYQMFFVNNTYDILLGLTGFVTKDKEELLNKYAPVCHRYSTQQAQSDGILNKTKFILVEYPLFKVKNIEVKLKNGYTMFKSEVDTYKYYERKFDKLNEDYEKAKSNYYRNKTFASTVVGEAKRKEFEEKADEYKRKLEKISAKIKSLASRRHNFMCQLDSSALLTRYLSEYILGVNERNKLLVFSKSSAQIDRILENTHHNKRRRPELVYKLNSGEIRSLGLCKILDRGANLVGVNYIIFESYDGSETNLQQRHGRGVRLSPDDTLFFIILIPHYEDEGRFIQTQASVWTKKMLNSFELENSVTVQIRTEEDMERLKKELIEP